MKIKPIINALFPDLYILAGLCSVFYGLSMVYLPSAYIICGVFLVFAFWKKPPKRTPKPAKVAK